MELAPGGGYENAMLGGSAEISRVLAGIAADPVEKRSGRIFAI